MYSVATTTLAYHTVEVFVLRARPGWAAAYCSVAAKQVAET